MRRPALPAIRINLPAFKAALAEQRLTQRELSTRLGIAETHLSAAVRGARPLSDEAWARIAAELHVDPTLLGIEAPAESAS